MSSGLVRLLSLGVIGGAIIFAQPVLAALSQSQRDWYSARLAANAKGRFDSAAMSPVFVTAPTEPVAEALVLWDKLRRDAYPASFEELSRFLRAHPGWPAEMTLRRRAERAILPTTGFGDRIAYFDRFPPLTATAQFRLAEAYLATGRGAEALKLARLAWTSGDLPPNVEAELLARFGSSLTPADHLARIDRLLWSGQISAASRLIGYIPADRRAWADARIAMRSNAPDAAVRLARVPMAQRDDPGLILDRVAWMRRNNDTLGARQLLAQTAITTGLVLDPVAWMKARLEVARGAANDSQYELAYKIAADHRTFPLGRPLAERPQSERIVYTDIEWFAGWLALKQLRWPELAMRHFQNFRTASLTPVSQARGDYWTGRALEAAGREAEARSYYAAAGTHPDQFYGQLALERIGRPIALPPAQPIQVSNEARQRFNNSEIVQATRILGELGDRTRQTIFMRSLVEQAETPAEQRLVADLGQEFNRPDLGVLAGKAARNNGQLALADAAFPRLSLGPILDAAWTMIHAISRQESLFDRTAVSPVNARGLMQLMPATAQETARKIGLPYDYGRLTEDPSYNVTLGSTYFQNLLASFGGNHVLAVAAYNAGPGNVRKWIRTNGDPRDPNIDVVDWIEAIPYSETRNYVQRVLENAVVYDTLHPRAARMPATNRLSAYLGKGRPG